MIRVVFLISGSGSTVEAVFRAIQTGILAEIQPVAVIASKNEAGGIAKAQSYGIQTEVIHPNSFRSSEGFGEALLSYINSQHIDVISQNGWLPLTPASVVKQYRGKIINQHPGPLDPGRVDFGGKGMYGSRVTCARVAYLWLTGSILPDGRCGTADSWTESTIHYVTEEFDTGTVIQTKRVPIPQHHKRVTLSELRKNPKVLLEVTQQVQNILLPVEHQNVIEVLSNIAANNIRTVSRSTPLIPEQYYGIVNEAKQLAIELFPHG